MKKVLFFVLAFAATFALVFIGAGLSSKPAWAGSKTQIYDAPADSIWYLLKDTYRYNTQRHEVAGTEMLVDSGNYRKWREHTNLFGGMLLETVRETPPQILETRMIESGFGMKGIWTFTLTPEGEKTKITISENSVTDGFVMRSILTLVGRDGNLQLQTRVLQRHVANMKINS